MNIPVYVFWKDSFTVWVRPLRVGWCEDIVKLLKLLLLV